MGGSGILVSAVSGQRVYDTLTFGEVELFEPFLLSPLNLPLQLPRDTTHTTPTHVAALAESSDIKLNSFQSHLHRNIGTGHTRGYLKSRAIVEVFV